MVLGGDGSRILLKGFCERKIVLSKWERSGCIGRRLGQGNGNRKGP